MKGNERKLFDQYAQQLAKALFSKHLKIDSNRQTIVDSQKTLKLFATNGNLIDSHELSKKETSNLWLKARKYLATQKEGIYLEIYVPFLIAGATILAMLINALLEIDFSFFYSEEVKTYPLLSKFKS